MKTLTAIALCLFLTSAYSQSNDRERDAKTACEKRWKVAIPQKVTLDVSKSKRRMVVTLSYKNKTIVLDTIPIGLMDFEKGTKTREGDKKTPEGTYKISQFNSNSQYHLSMKLDYPHKNEIHKGVNPGGDVFIHGQIYSKGNWYYASAGCISIRQQHIIPLYWLCKQTKNVQVTIHY
jgi:murein L,D-transpeptidase YafK